MILDSAFLLFVDFTNWNETILRDNWSVMPVEYRFCNVLPLLLSRNGLRLLNQLLSELSN